jgi:tetraprenyl-beta-curcumene synthase
MTPSSNGAVSHVGVGLALSVANARYWLTVAPHVHQELRRWQQQAQAIRDPTLRGHALAKLRDEHFNAQVAATLATLAPRRHRARVIEAIVAFQVMYDYLDALGEEPPATVRDGRQLFQAFSDALTPDARPADYYCHHSQRDDGGYLDRLAATCRTALATLPSAATVAPLARRAATACGQSQTLTHTIPLHGTGPLREWASAEAAGTGLLWWEYAAGAAASSLTVHALLAAAADIGTTQDETSLIASAYFPICALSTLLDSLIDREHDAQSGSHSYISYYESPADAAHRIAQIARDATTAVRGLRHAPHHAITVAGVAGYYLSAPGAANRLAQPVATSVIRALQPAVTPVLAIFSLWRRAKQGAPDWYSRLVLPMNRRQTGGGPKTTEAPAHAGLP